MFLQEIRRIKHLSLNSNVTCLFHSMDSCQQLDLKILCNARRTLCPQVGLEKLLLSTYMWSFPLTGDPAPKKFEEIKYLYNEYPKLVLFIIESTNNVKCLRIEEAQNPMQN